MESLSATLRYQFDVEVSLVLRSSLLMLFLLSGACSNPAETTSEERGIVDADSAQSSLVQRPNIVLIVADDLGYSDLGAFGSEIHTPNLDALSNTGKMLSNFHVGPTCSPSRAMLLSGTDAHRAGLGTMNGMQSPQQLGQPGYEGFLNKQVVSFVRLLKDAGYHTYMAGKWHLGYEQGYYPLDRGFEKAFWLKNGAASHYADMRGILENDHPASWAEGGERVQSLPADFYSTTYFTDKLIEYIDSNMDDAQPFFAYAAYTSPHWPLQAPQHYIDKYEGVYDGGYDRIRQQRIEKMRSLGLISEEQIPAPQHHEWPDWDDLSDEQKKLESRRMQLYAAMVGSLDANVGRLVQHLKDIGEYENTLIVFFSDNGAEGNNPADISTNNTWIAENFDNSYENMGKPGSYVSVGPGWAHVSSTPFHLYKGFPTQGGILSPGIVAWPDSIKSNTRSDAFVTILDLAPTFLALAGVSHPAPDYNGRSVEGLKGTSMTPLLFDKKQLVHDEDYVYGIELFNRRMIRQGDWKLLWINKPWGKNGWALYNLSEDIAEQHDLANSRPEKLSHMLGLWDAYVQENGVFVFPELHLGFTNGKNHYN